VKNGLIFLLLSLEKKKVNLKATDEQLDS
jgi:hypothetical protein